ncbi:MAG: hypothetical protein ACTHKG_17050, partial [Nocardioides sp.]
VTRGQDPVLPERVPVRVPVPVGVCWARVRAARRGRRARVFGEVLPEATSDDRGDAWGDREASSDEWLRRQVPPHHGG